MSKHNSNTDRHDGKNEMAKASSSVSPGKRAVMAPPRGGSAGVPKVQFPGKAVMEESQEAEKGFKRGGRTGHSHALPPKAPGFAHKHGPVRPAMTETPEEDINEMAGKKRGGRAKKEGGVAHDDGMVGHRADKPARKARGGATTMRGRSPLSSAHETELPTRSNTH